MCALLYQYCGGEIMFIDVDMDEKCAPEWFSFTSLDTPYLFNRE